MGNPIQGITNAAKSFGQGDVLGGFANALSAVGSVVPGAWGAAANRVGAVLGAINNSSGDTSQQQWDLAAQELGSLFHALT